MATLTFDNLLSQAFQLYQNQEYAQALALLTQHASQFPERAQTLYFWRMCLATRSNESDLAIELFRQALAAGFWYSEAQLRQDDDLKPLQGLPDFEQLAKISLERYAEARARAVPVLITLPPDLPASTPTQKLLLALHGNNSNAKSFAEHWQPAVSAGWLVALAQSSQVSGSDTYIWNDYEQAKREILEHHAVLCKQYAIVPNQIVLGGFSMGGETVIRLALEGALPVRGFLVVALGGRFTRESERWRELIEASPVHGLRGYIVSGEQDLNHYATAKTLADLLNAHAIPCEFETHADVGHAFPPDFEQTLTRALEYICAK